MISIARRQQCREDRLNILRSLLQDGELKQVELCRELNGKSVENDLKVLESQGLITHRKIERSGRCVLRFYSITLKGRDFIATLEGIAA